MENFNWSVFIVFTVTAMYLSTQAYAKPLDDDTMDTEKLELLTNELRNLQINSLAYPDDDGLPTTLTPTDTDNAFSVENINSYSTTTTYAPEDALKSLLDSSRTLDNEDDDDESNNENEERQHEILIIVTQTTTATVLTFIVGFLIVCVLFCVLSLCMTIKTPRPMAIAVPPTINKNNITPLIATKVPSSNVDCLIDAATKKWTYNNYRL